MPLFGNDPPKVKILHVHTKGHHVPVGKLVEGLVVHERSVKAADIPDEYDYNRKKSPQWLRSTV